MGVSNTAGVLITGAARFYEAGMRFGYMTSISLALGVATDNSGRTMVLVYTGRALQVGEVWEDTGVWREP